MEENIIRRERLRKSNKERLMKELRAALPVYNLEEIRLYKMPYHEALYNNLEDGGHRRTCRHVRQLCNFQQKIREEAGPVNPLWTKPQLQSSKEEMTALCDFLIKCEDYHNCGDFGMEVEELLKAAVHFAFSNEDWWWLGEQLLITSLLLSEKYKYLGDKKYQALSRYVYGKFLIENLKGYEAAEQHLTIARQLSRGEEWTAKIFFPSETDVLFLTTNYLLYVCLIRQAESLLETDYVEAARLAVVARKRACEACYKEGEITALMLKGMCLLSGNDTKGAISIFTKAYYIQSKLGFKRGACEARIQIARAYLLDGNTHLSLNTLLLLRKSAEEFDLPYYLAQSYRHLGEHFLNNGEASRAIPLLAESLKIFGDLGGIKESEQVRNLEAISIGLESLPNYIDILCNADEEENLMKLCQWKDSRKPFVELSTRSSLTLQTVIEQSMAQLKNPETTAKRLKSMHVDMMMMRAGTQGSLSMKNW